MHYYCATHAFHIPADVRGTVTLEINLDPNRTFFKNPMADDVPIGDVFPGNIIMGTGSCCGITSEPLSCADDVTIDECETLGGVFELGGTCSGMDADGDGVDGTCDPCPSDFNDDSDGDGSCDSDDICPGADDFADDDGDTVPDGCDQCPGIDEIKFPDCLEPVPSVSAWGLVTLALLLLTAAKLSNRRHPILGD
jgi:hypothetical protein